ncbi:ABC transporter permease [Halobacterium noricense]|uniref:ABC transporter permease n=1 Tax=Halobacterium noricense TaxID=223182 RepID=UPI001E282FBD|nr:ABC transporter permease [Halobacterium noricense]UHH26198.1 ABC transporter permease [Halobacterium noricense]
MSFSTGLKSLTRREILRFVRRPYNTFLPPLITNVLYFSVFGVILGARISDIGGVPYIQFILPGLAVLGAVSNAFENASFSIFHGRWNEYIHETLTSPMAYWEMVVAYVVSSALRGVLIGILIAVIGALFTPVRTLAHPFYAVAFLGVITTLFAAFGVIGGLVAEDFDHLTVLNQFILRPLVFFGGVFYSLDALDGLARTASYLNPMVYMVNGVRYGIIGVSDIEPDTALVVLSALTVVVLAIDVWLFQRGYGLTD